MKKLLLLAAIAAAALVCLPLAAHGQAPDARAVQDLGAVIAPAVIPTPPPAVPVIPPGSIPIAQALLALIAFAIWEAWLGATKRIPPNSTLALIVWIIQQLAAGVARLARGGGAALLLLGIGLVAGAVGCGFCQIKDNQATSRCRLEQATRACAAASAAPIPSQAGESVIDILNSSGANWQADLEALAVKIGGSDGLAFISCEVQAIASIYSKAGAEPDASLTPATVLAARARAWLEKHPSRAPLTAARCR